MSFAINMLVFAVLAFLIYHIISSRQIKRAARQILEITRKSFTEWRDLRLLGKDQLPVAMVERLEEARRAVEPLGFSHLCDMEDQTFTRANNGLLIPIRYFFEEKRELMVASYFHPVIGHLLFDVVTELSDGSTLMTSNATQAGDLIVPPNMLQKFLAPTATVEELVRAHREWLARELEVRPELHASVPATPGAVLDRYQRANREKWEFHRDRGWITLEELQKMSPNNSEALARRVHAEIQEILRKERESAH